MAIFIMISCESIQSLYKCSMNATVLISIVWKSQIIIDYSGQRLRDSPHSWHEFLSVIIRTDILIMICHVITHISFKPDHQPMVYLLLPIVY